MKKLIIDRREVSLTAGNLRNGHIYLKAILDFFPSQAVGGSDSTQLADRLLTVTFIPGVTVQSDITGRDRLKRPGRSKHCFLRNRGAVRDFFERSGAQAGDVAEIIKTGPYAYTFSLAE
jgi:hypothetical protein